MQSARGREAILCSILPSLRGKISTDYSTLSLRALPRILSEHGYRCLCFDGFSSFSFDNMDVFLPNLGFDDCQPMDESILDAEDMAHVWGWGLQDDYMFRKVFALLDKRQRGKGTPADQTLFVMINTVSHHYPFDYQTPGPKSPYPQPANRRQVFANSLHRADGYLTEFFHQLEQRSEFKDSLVILTGDHSFPAGEHGIYYNEQGFYEEVFRTPLVMLWNGRISPQVIDEPHCQLDIAPTILELLNIQTDNHFLGRSLFDPPDSARAIHLIQPYDGTHLCVVKGGLKYVQSVRVPGEYLFDLTKDPHEAKNVLSDYRGTKALRELRQEIKRIWLNQMLIERNRIWPANGHE